MGVQVKLKAGSNERNIKRNNKRKIQANNTTGFKGIFKDYGKYRAKITVDRKCIELGRYDTKEEAAQAYDNYIIKQKLEHTLNFNYKELNEKHNFNKKRIC